MKRQWLLATPKMIAMGNGNDHVKKISNYITTNIDEDGLKNAFKHFGLID